MQLDKNLYEEINEYCKLNNLKTRDFIHKILKDAFVKEKYGDTPFFFNKIKNANEEASVEGNIFNEKIDPEITKIIDEHFYEMFDTVTAKDESLQKIEEKEEVKENTTTQVKETISQNTKPKKKRKLN